MLTIELFGFRATKYVVEAEIIKFFNKFDPKIDGQIIFYEIDPKNFRGEGAKVMKLIASNKRLMKKLRDSDFLQLECFKDVNIGLFYYIIVKKANTLVNKI